ncbi:hypothetical protein AB4144_08140, partial [Rhizobiaceae sp. 2RAB30]
MADFVAVLRKTIDGLGETTPEMRRRVYEKARATVANKLAALNPPPPASVAERQKKTLEDAIAEIEASFAPPPPAPRVTEQSDPLAELENVFASLKAKPAELPPLPSARKEAYPETKPWPVTTPKPAAEAPKPAFEPLKPAAPQPAVEAPKPAPEVVKPVVEAAPVAPPRPVPETRRETPRVDVPPVARQEPSRPQPGDFDTISSVDDRGFDGEHEVDDEPELDTPRRRRGYG